MYFKVSYICVKVKKIFFRGFQYILDFLKVFGFTILPLFVTFFTQFRSDSVEPKSHTS